MTIETLLTFFLLQFIFFARTFADGGLFFASCNVAEFSNVLDYAMIQYNPYPTSLSVYALNSECYSCAKILLANASTIYTFDTDANAKCPFVWTPYKWTLYLIDNEGNEISRIDYDFGSNGVYSLIVGQSGIKINELIPPIDVMQPFLNAIGVLITVIVLAFATPLVFKYLKTRFFGDENHTDSISSPINSTSEIKNNYIQVGLTDPMESNTKLLHSPLTSPQGQPTTNTTRLQSLDTFRGISLTFMIFCNYGGGGYYFFEHVPWNGLTFADLLFPWFMWIMGVSMALSFDSKDPDLKTLTTFQQLQSPSPSYSPWKFLKSFICRDPTPLSCRYLSLGARYCNMWYLCIRRSVILFLIGMFLANGYEYSTWRIPGVLQYFSFANLLVMSTVLLFLPVTNAEITRIQDLEDQEGGRGRGTRRVPNMFSWLPKPYLKSSYAPSFPLTKIMFAYRYEWIVQSIILIIYLAVSLGAQAPGCPRGYNGPGGLANDGLYPSCTGGIHRYIDIQFFGYDYIYHNPTCKEIYECIAYDPEGFLGALSATTLTYLGLMSGRIIIHFPANKERLTRWIIWSVCLLLLAGLLCEFSQNGGIIPVNKNLWSTSFVFLSAGIGLICLALTYLLVDVFHVWTGAPFRYLGLNSILIYVGHDLLGGYFPFSYMTDESNHGDLLQMNIVGVVAWLAVAYLCFRNKFFVKI